MKWSTPLLSLLLLLLLLLLLAAADGQGECGRNVVPISVVPSKPCKLRASRGDLNVSDAKLQEEISVGLQKGAKMAEELLKHEQEVSETLDVPLHTPAYHHYLTNMASDRDKGQVRAGLRDLANATAVARHLSRTFNIAPEATGDLLISQCIPADPSHVLQVPTCNTYDIYRTHNGACNSLEFPTWGMTDTPFIRLMSSDFSDGINKPKVSACGKKLPIPRRLRTRLLPTGEFDDDTNTLMTMQFGQLIAHDTALSADWLGYDGLGIQCCSRDNTHLPCKRLSVGCYPVKIPDDDEYYGAKGVKCMSLARSMKKYTSAGCLGPAETVNNINHLLDCSMIYGSDKERADQLREFKGGRLRTQSLPDGRKFLPQVNDPVESCSLYNSTETCFFAGDVRVNQNTQLTALHVVLVREHNRVARHMSSMNPHWDDEKIYEESRRMVIAQYQSILYNEFLPRILRKDWLEKFHLSPSKTGFSNCYNVSINPSTVQEFTQAAYRKFHGIAQSMLLLFKDVGCPVGKIKISRWMDKPEILVRDYYFDQLILGLTQQAATKDDDRTVFELNNYLFRVDQPYGQDLDTFDIKRGRDNGLKNYNDYREYLGLPRAKKFEDFCDLMPCERAMELSQIYECPDDVELMMVMLEDTNRDIMSVGDAILLDQFYRWKCGDRYTFDYSESPYPFTTAQINAIKEAATMSRLICDNSDNITRIQTNSFQKVSSMNEVVQCKDLPALDLSLWKEDK